MTRWPRHTHLHAARALQRQPLRLWVAVLLAFCLAQGLGLWHAAEHGWQRGVLAAEGVHALHDGHDTASDGCDVHGAHSHGLQAGMAQPALAHADHWQHEAGSAECRLLDQLVADSAPAAPIVAIAPPAAPQRLHRDDAQTLGALSVPGVLARGPPQG
jgi:hypothetical protein